MSINEVNISLYKLSDYCVKGGDYRSHKDIVGVSHKIPLSDMTDYISANIIKLLLSGKYLLGLAGNVHILLSNNGNNVSTFSDKVEEGSCLWEYCDLFYTSMGGKGIFTGSISMDRYSNEERLASICDAMMRDSNSGDLDSLLVMSMNGEESFEFREIGKSWLKRACKK